MIKKSIHEALAEATDAQIRAWWKEVSEKGEWPASLPLTHEVVRIIWQPLQHKFLNLPYKETKVKGE